MYKYYDDVTKIFNIVLESAENLKDKSKEFYERNGMKFFNEYMSLPQNENRPLNTITYFDINSYIEALPFSSRHKVNVYNSLKNFLNTHTKRELLLM